MKKITLLAMVVIYLFFVSSILGGAEKSFSVGGFTINPESSYLHVANKLIEVKVFPNGKVLKKEWKQINDNEEQRGFITATSSTFSTTWIGYSEPESKKPIPLVEISSVGFKLIWDKNNERLTIKNDEFELRVHSCGMIQKLTWRELEK